MKFGDFLNTLAKKVGQENNPALVAILSNAELANRDINDDFANALDNNLMSLDGAKNNSAVLNHFKPIILKGIDERFSILGEKLVLGDDFLNEKSTYKKAELLESKLEAKIKDLEAKQGTSGDPKKEAEFTRQINELTGKLQALSTDKETAITELKKQHEGQLTDMLIGINLSGLQYANKDMPAEVNVGYAKTLLQSQLQAKGVTLINDNGMLKLKQTANPTLDFLDEGFKPVSFNDFSQKVLADNKLLAVSGGTPPPPAPGQKGAPAIIPAAGGGQQVNTASFMEAVNSSMPAAQ